MATADVVTVELRAKIDSHIANINKATNNFSQKLAAMEAAAVASGAAFTRVGQGASVAFNRIQQQAPKAAAAVKGINAELKFLPAQLNDIGVSLASGQSPFLVAIQQGAQISQALGGMGARGAVAALGGAFMQLLSPVSLATFAITGVAVVAASYFADLITGGEDAEETLKAQADLLERIADKWGDAVPEIKAYVDELKRVKDETDLIAGTKVIQQKEFSQLVPALEKIRGGLIRLNQAAQGLGVAAQVAPINKAFDDLVEKTQDGSATMEDFKDLQRQIWEAFNNLSIPAIEDFGNALGAIETRFEKVAQAAEDAGQRIRDALKRDELPVYDPRDPRFNNGILPPTAPVPNRLGPDDVGSNSFDRGGDLERAGESVAAAMIKEFEGFISNAKYDVNAFRVGFGSDTTTDATGNVSRVTQATVTTLEDANRDLGRRILDFQDAIKSAIGEDTFASFTEQQQAVLTSIAYNYGSLPDRIVKAIATGNPATVASAIAALGTDNKGVNQKRRLREAEVFGGAAFDAKDAGYGRQKKTPEELFSGSTEKVQERIDILNAELEAQKGVTAGVNDYGFAVEKARIKQQLLNDAQAAGLTITPELASKIDTLAGNYARASAASDQFQQSQKDAAKAAQEAASFGKDVLGGFIQDMINGKSAAEALAGALEKIASKLLDIALDQLFTGGGAGGGGLGAIFAGLFKAQGGPVKKGQPYIVGERRPELFVPDSNGKILPSVPKVSMPSGRASGAQPAGGFIRVSGEFAVQNGNLVPLITGVSGLVAGQQVKQANRNVPQRVAQSNTRGT